MRNRFFPRRERSGEDSQRITRAEHAGRMVRRIGRKSCRTGRGEIMPALAPDIYGGLRGSKVLSRQHLVLTTVGGRGVLHLVDEEPESQKRCVRCSRPATPEPRLRPDTVETH